MRRDPEWFGEDELELVLVARRLRDAQRVEGLLDREGLDYAVSAEEYRASLLLLPVRRVGAFFWVRPDEAARARDVLRARGERVVEVEAEGPARG